MSKRHYDFVSNLAVESAQLVCNDAADWILSLPDTMPWERVWERANAEYRSWMRRARRNVRRWGRVTPEMAAVFAAIPALLPRDEQSSFMRALHGRHEKRDLKHLHDADRWTLRALKAQLGAP